MKYTKLILMTLAVVAFASCENTHKRPEITWSLMHPTHLDTVYMAKVIENLPGHPVDNFEVCGGCNSFNDGSLDGLLYFEEYPLAAACQNVEQVDHNRKSIVRMVQMAHEAGMPMYYWHREVLCNDGLVKSIPGLLDENGEFDLLGKPYEDLLRYKIRKTFELVPDLDGLVLTLTEASYSVMHNSRPDLYPPVKVIEHIAGVFAEEMHNRGKRFILRSFASSDEDYMLINKAATALSQRYDFEVEGKIVPQDFSPFLPDNPYLQHPGNATIGAECDVLGEYLGAGRMPAEDVENIVRYVRHAQKCNVDRYTLRLDRHNRNIFDSYPLTLYAYEQALLYPKKTADQIRSEYYHANYPAEVAEELIVMSREGIKAILQTEFIHGNLIFHQFPTTAWMKYIKSGGILSTFVPDGVQTNCKYQWGMVLGKKTPGREAILAEKAEALALVEQNLARLESLKDKLSAQEYERLLRLWNYAYRETYSINEYTKVIAAYFDSMEARDPKGQALNEAFADLKSKLAGQQWPRPILELAQLFVDEYPIEFAMREKLLNDSAVVDFILPGGSMDQIRMEYFMHACYPGIQNGKLVINAGNPMYPDGGIKVEFKGSDKPVRFYVEGFGDCLVTVNGVSTVVNIDGGAFVAADACAEGYEVKCNKPSGIEYPMVAVVAQYI